MGHKTKPANWLYTAVVKMEVTVQVEFPMAAIDDNHIIPTDALAIDCALSSVTPFLERDCGKMDGRIVWAKVFAEVSDKDCEVTTTLV